MKKIWLALAGLVLAFSASAAQYEDGNSTLPWKNRLAGRAASAGVFPLSSVRTAIEV